MGHRYTYNGQSEDGGKYEGDLDHSLLFFYKKMPLSFKRFKFYLNFEFKHIFIYN